MLLVVLVLKVTVKQYAEAELTAVSVSHHSPSPFLHSLQTFGSWHPDSQNLPREAPHFSLQKKRVHPHSTRLPLSQSDSAPATLQFPPATFLQFENPGNTLRQICLGLV